MAATTEAVDTRSALRDLIEEGKRFARNWRLNLGKDGVPLRAMNRCLADAEAALAKDDPPEHGTVIVTIRGGSVQGADVVGAKPAEVLILDLDDDEGATWSETAERHPGETENEVLAGLKVVDLSAGLSPVPRRDQRRPGGIHGVHAARHPGRSRDGPGHPVRRARCGRDL